MSLLEDVFLQDEAGEAQELERVIEGDEYDERPVNSDDNSEKEDEAEEDKRRVDPNSNKPQRVVKNPRFILNSARLTGPRGIQVIPDHFKDFKFKGKGHERDDLDLVLKKLEHWAYRLYPKFQFEDCLKKIETLGKKRPVMVHLQKIRSDQLLSEETVVQKDSSDEDTPQAPEEDEFDKLLQQQIELARVTPAPVKKGFGTPVDRSSYTIPSATSSPLISDEQKERIMRNRKLAEERRLARLKQNTSNVEQSEVNSFVSNNQEDVNENGILTRKNGSVDHDNVRVEPENRIVNTENGFGDHNGIHDPENQSVGSVNTITVVNDNITDEVLSVKKHNRSNVIDSDTDDECDITTVNQSVTVDIHESRVTYADKNNDVFESLKENNKNENSNQANQKVYESKFIEDSNATGSQETHCTNNIDVKIVQESKENNIASKVVTEDSNFTTNGESIQDVENLVMDTTTSNVNEIDKNEDAEVTEIDKNKNAEAAVTKMDKNVIAQVTENDKNDDVVGTGVEEDLMDVDFSDDF